MRSLKISLALLTFLTVVAFVTNAQEAVPTVFDPNVVGESINGLIYAQPELPSQKSTPVPKSSSTGLAGTYNVGSGGSYTSLRGMVDALNTTPIKDDVTFLLTDATYLDSVLNISTITYATVSKSVTIKPAPGNSPTINLRGGAIAGFTFTGVGNITIDGSNDGSTTRHLTIKMDTSTGNPSGIAMTIRNGSRDITLKNFSLKGYRILGGTSTASLIMSLSNANNTTKNRNITFDNLAISSGFRALAGGGFDSTALDSNIVFRNCSIGTTSPSRNDSLTSTPLLMSLLEDAHFYNNSISGTRRPPGFGNSNVFGLQLTGKNFYVYNNRVHNIRTDLKTGVNTVQFFIGILLQGISGTTLNPMSMVYNNMVHDIYQGYSGSVSHWLHGIYTDLGAADEIYFNSVHLSGTGTTATNSACFYMLRSSVVVANNVFFNGRTDAATVRAVAFWKNWDDPLSVISASDVNDLYYSWGTGGAVGARLVGTTTTYFGTLNAWQAATGQDANSISANPQFDLTSPLHIRTDVPTPVESRGIPIPGITTDYDGDVRNGSTPDIGADEGTFMPAVLMSYSSSTTSQNTAQVVAGATNAQVIGMQVVTSGTDAPLSVTRFALKTNGTTNVADISNARVYYSGTSAVFAPANQFGSTVASPSGSFGINGSQSLQEGTNYFWLTYDVSGSAPEGNVIDGECDTVVVASVDRIPTVTAPAGSRSIVVPIVAGDHMIGGSLFERVTGKKLEFETRTRRVMREVPVAELVMPKTTGATTASHEVPMRTKRMFVDEEYSVILENGKPYEGPMVADVPASLRGAEGFSENAMTVYPTITAALADLNLRGVVGHTRFLFAVSSYPGETYPLTVNVTSPSVPNASRTVTFKPNTGVSPTISGGPASGSLFKIISTNYVTIDGSNTPGGTTRNLTITSTTATSPNVIHIGSSGITPITNITVKNCLLTNGTQTSSAVVVGDGATVGSAGVFSDITLENNLIQRAYMGVYTHGGTTPQGGSGLVYVSNNLDATGTNAIRYIGLYMQGINGATIRGNRIGNFEQSSAENDRGMWLASGTINATAERNSIHSLIYSGTLGYGPNGIAVSSSATGANNTLRNNFIYNIRGDGDNYLTDLGFNPMGIYIFGTQTGISAYYNSINLYGNSLNFHANAMSIGICLATGSTGSIRNNNIVNNLGLLAATGYGSVGVFAQSANTQFTAIDNNNYYVNPSGSGVKALGQIATAAATTLGDWQTASGQDAASVSGDPLYTSNTDLHITSVSSPSSNAAAVLAGVVDDYDGDARHPSTPDIGADEFGGSVMVSVPILVGWNMIANPVTTAADSVKQLYPTSTFNYAFTFTGAGGYQQAFRMLNGKGYWGKFASASVVDITGASRSSEVIPVIAGWNMVGSISANVDTSTITSTPTGIRASDWFAYSGAYSAASQIVPGKAYWVKAFQAGSFTFSSSAPAGRPSGSNTLGSLSTLTITDANGATQTLYFGAEGSADVTTSWYDMPPVPPAGAFDARFESETGGRMVEMVGADLGVAIQSVAYPLTVSWNIKGSGSFDLADGSGAGVFASKTMAGEGSLVIASPSVNRLVIMNAGGAEGLPKEFALMQNYPNPFNPTTNIKFALPVESRVTVEIYNALGQKVRTLVNEDRKPGYHVAEWNGAGNGGQQLASGVYFARFNASGADGRSFSDIRKLMMVK